MASGLAPTLPVVSRAVATRIGLGRRLSVARGDSSKHCCSVRAQQAPPGSCSGGGGRGWRQRRRRQPLAHPARARMDDSDAEEEEDELEFEDDDDEEEEEDAARLYLEYGLDPTTATPKDLLAAMDQRTRDDTAAREVALELERGLPPLLRLEEQAGLSAWAPGTTGSSIPASLSGTATVAGGGGGGGSGGGDGGATATPAGAATATYEELLATLPGLQRQLRAAAQERAGLPTAETNADTAEPSESTRLRRKEERALDEWDLRAKMEKRRRQQRETDEWRARQAEIGRYPSIGADWRTDTRCGATGNPTDPVYREWTHKEVWDLITNSGANADPRDVRLRVDNPVALADVLAEGGRYNPDPVEYFESLGRLIHEDDEAAIMDSAGEAALLAADFSDFDDVAAAASAAAAAGLADPFLPGGGAGGAASAAGGDFDDDVAAVDDFAIGGAADSDDDF